MTINVLVPMIYATLCATAAAGASLVWRLSQPDRHLTLQPGDLDDVDVAALNGGPQLAVIAAAAGLRRGNVEATEGGRLIATDPLADDACELRCEIFETLVASPAEPAAELLADAAEGPAARRVVARLQEAGLLLDEAAEQRMNVAWRCCRWLASVAPWLVFLFVAESLLVPAAVVTALGLAMLATMLWLGRRRSGASAAGRALVRDVVRTRSAALDAGRDPGLTVAIFGSRGLTWFDPTYARALGVQTQETERERHGWATAFVAAWDMTFDGGDDDDGCGGCGCG